MSDELLTVYFFPSVKMTDLETKPKYKYSLKELNGLGSGFAIVAAEMAQLAMSSTQNEGLYRCIFPEGVTGQLATFNDGSGYLGTIMNKSGIAAQARWIPAEGQSIAMAVNPVTLAIAVAVIDVNKKLDKIQQTQEDILAFLKQDKESKIEGNLIALQDIMNQYRYNSENAQWKSGKLTAVTNIKTELEAAIVFYKRQLNGTFRKQKKFHSNSDADKLMNEIDTNLKNYQMCTYLVAYASFLEVILGDNYKNDFLHDVTERISEYSYQYRIDYTKCYEQLEEYMKGSFQSIAFSGIGQASKVTGKTLAKIPVLNKSKADEALVDASRTIKKIGSKHGRRAMKAFSENNNAGTRMFIENIKAIETLCNRPVEMIMDGENVYISELEVKKVCLV